MSHGTKSLLAIAVVAVIAGVCWCALVALGCKALEDRYQWEVE